MARPLGGARRRDHRHLGRLPRLAWPAAASCGRSPRSSRLRPRHPPHRSALAHRVVRPGADRPSGVARSRRPGSPMSPGPASACRSAAAPGSRRSRPARRGPRRRSPASARVLPGRGHWDFAADGPLAWLRGARQLGRSGSATSGCRSAERHAAWRTGSSTRSAAARDLLRGARTSVPA